MDPLIFSFCSRLWQFTESRILIRFQLPAAQTASTPRELSIPRIYFIFLSSGKKEKAPNRSMFFANFSSGRADRPNYIVLSFFDAYIYYDFLYIFRDRASAALGGAWESSNFIHETSNRFHRLRTEKLPRSIKKIIKNIENEKSYSNWKLSLEIFFWSTFFKRAAHVEGRSTFSWRLSQILYLNKSGGPDL